MHCWSGGRLGAGAGKSPQQLLLLSCTAGRMAAAEMTPVGFEPTQLALVELESTPLDHSGKLSLQVPERVSTIVWVMVVMA